MRVSRRHAVKGRRRWPWGAVAIASGVVALLTGIAAALALRVARVVLIPETRRSEEVTVLSVNRPDRLVELSNHPEAVLPGRYSVYFDQDRGYAQVGDIVAASTTSLLHWITSI